jgi:hypothetical protein
MMGKGRPRPPVKCWVAPPSPRRQIPVHVLPRLHADAARHRHATLTHSTTAARAGSPAHECLVSGWLAVTV